MPKKLRIGIDIGELTTSLAAIDAGDETLVQRHTLAIVHWAQYNARTCSAVMNGALCEQGPIGHVRKYSAVTVPAESNEAMTRNLLWLLSNDVSLCALVADVEQVHVTIEQQLPNAMTNRILSHVVQAWFVMRSLERQDRVIQVEFQHGSRSAAVQILCDDPPCEYAAKLERKLASTSDYRRKKATTVRDARRLLTCAPHPGEWLRFFDTWSHDQSTEKKKKSVDLPDNADLADALLHALSGELISRNLPLVWPTDNHHPHHPQQSSAVKRKRTGTGRKKKNGAKKKSADSAGQAYFASLVPSDEK